MHSIGCSLLHSEEREARQTRVRLNVVRVVVVADQEEQRSPCATAYTPSRLTLTMSLVLPGEHVPAQHVNLKLGPGLLQSSSTQGQAAIVSTRAGEVMNNPKGNKWWIEGNSRRVSAPAHAAHCYSRCTRQYVPAPQESVVGVVISRSGENWRVDIGSAHMASLDGLAFEGATKRNRPNLKVCRHITRMSYLY